MRFMLSRHIQCGKFKEGLALFDRFKGDTHFVRAPYASVIERLDQGGLSSNRLGLLVLSECQLEVAELESFIEQCLKLGIIESAP